MSLKVMKGVADLEDLQSRCEKTISRRDEKGNLLFRKFFQYLDMIGGYYCWMPAQFDIKHHVRIVDGLDPEKTVSEKEVMEILSENANLPFAAGRAPWEILIIPKFLYNKELHENQEDLEDKFGMVIRIHHGMGDGFSLMKLIMRDMAGLDPDQYKPPVKDPGKPWPWWYRIFAFFYILWKSPRCFYHEMSKKDSNPLHDALTKVSGEKFIVWSEQINVKWLKQLKTEMNGGMNTMLLGAVSGALRSYILEQQHGSSKLPQEITALIPAPAPNHPNNTMTNKFAIVMYPLECKSHDPRVRCAAIAKTGKEIAISPEPHVNLFLTQLIGVAPAIFSKFFIYNTQSTVVISNLPGPDRTIKIWGKPLVETMFWLPNVGHSGVSVSILSYTDTLRIGMTVDKGIIPEGQQGARHLINLTVRELEKMARVVGMDPKGHGISEELLYEPGVRRHNSEDELEELLLPDSSPLLSTRRRRRSKGFKDTDSHSSSSEDYGYGEEESLDGDEEDNVGEISTAGSNLHAEESTDMRARKTLYKSVTPIST
ncbi:O-acyltransferase WSD1, partial [Orchesella cincta]